MDRVMLAVNKRDLADEHEWQMWLLFIAAQEIQSMHPVPAL